MAILKQFATRHAFSISLAVFIAYLVYHYFSESREPWILLTALMVCQTSKGTPFRQALISVVSIFTAILIATWLAMSPALTALATLLLVGLFVLSGYLVFINQATSSTRFYFVIYFSLIFMFAMHAPEKTELVMQGRFIDVILGAAIGMVCGQWVFPVKLEDEFRSGLVPVLKSLSAYSDCLTEYFFQGKSKLPCFPFAALPEWVYEVGFNPGLRSGFRFFLIHLERVGDIFCSMGYLSSQTVDDDLLRKVRGDMLSAMQKNRDLLTILTDYFAYNKINDGDADFTSDIALLEKTLQSVLPESLEFLEISPQYAVLTAYVRDIKDMRELLLQLVMSLSLKGAI